MSGGRVNSSWISVGESCGITIECWSLVPKEDRGEGILFFDHQGVIDDVYFKTAVHYVFNYF